MGERGPCSPSSTGMASRPKMISISWCSPLLNKRIVSSLSHPHVTPERLSQKSLPRLQFPFLLQLKFPSPEYCRHDQSHFHHRYVPADTSSWTVRKRNECCLLIFRNVTPAIGIKNVGRGAPDEGGVMDSVSRDGKDAALWKVCRVKSYAITRRDDARKADGGSRVHPKSFFDYRVEARKIKSISVKKRDR